MKLWDEVNEEWKAVPTLKGDTGPKGDQGIPGEGLIPGGTIGQVLKKKSDLDQDTEWGDAADPNAIKSIDGSVTDIRELTKAEYDALPQIDKDNNTYFITDDLGCGFDITYIFDKVYPIGRGFIDFTDIDYSDYLGFTWEKTCIGMFPVGHDTSQTEFDTIGKTGGAKTHTLTIDEMPANLIDTTDEGSNTDGFVMRGGYSPTGTYNIGGTGASHNNLPPYQTVNYWKRVS